jgi:hypothetical protein
MPDRMDKQTFFWARKNTLILFLAKEKEGGFACDI